MPLWTAGETRNVPFDRIETTSDPFCTVRPAPTRPETDTRTGKLAIEQVTCADSAGALVIVPVPWLTVQTWVGLLGWVPTTSAQVLIWNLPKEDGAWIRFEGNYRQNQARPNAAAGDNTAL